MDLFEHTHSVEIELSNMCSLAWVHKRCPLSLNMISPFRHRSPKILPAKIVRSVLDTLGEYSYSGAVYFHLYSEETIDPRYFEFVRYAKRVCPTLRVHSVTNGMYLSAQMAREMSEAGVDNLHMTLYGSKEDCNARHEWFIREIMPQFPKDQSNVLHFGKNMDNRIATNYDGEYLDLDKVCYAPFNDIIVNHEGSIILCCMDWKYEIAFGNLYEKKLDEIMREGPMQAAFDRLQIPDRSVYDLCRRCQTTRPSM